MGMGIANQGRNKGRVVAEINVTPLVDVMLVLLISPQCLRITSWMVIPMLLLAIILMACPFTPRR